MTLEQASYFSQIIAALGVLASLLFVGFQIRQNTAAMRAQTRQHIASSWFAMVPPICDHAEAFAAGLRSQQPGFADLTETDRLKFVSTIFGLFKHYENIYLEHRRGGISRDAWAPWSTHMRLYFHQPGVQTWWAMRKGSFIPEFQVYLETSEKPVTPTPAELLGKPAAQQSNMA